ncbi:hypothetical protein DV532_14490 [Pseudomonas sp. Leaf58]|nr:hypothetical protein DV532_14490 [Pseudomonas sp. Leaf58]
MLLAIPAEHRVTTRKGVPMKNLKPHALLLALCLAASAAFAQAATDMNDQRGPGTQPQGSGQMGDQGAASGAGTPADGLGTGSGGTDDNGTDNTGGDGTTDGSSSGRDGSPSASPGSATDSGHGGATGSGSSSGSGS